MAPEDSASADSNAASSDDATTPQEIVIRLDGRKHTISYQAGDTLLEACRRAGLRAPSSCESGTCGTCMAHLDEGTAAMRENHVLTPEEVATNWVLTCQAIPAGHTVVVDYDS